MARGRYLHTPTGIGELISDSDGASTRQVYSDGQGSTRLTVEGSTTQSWSYEAFGNLLEGSAVRTTHGYTGERFDPDTGLIYLRARDYDPRIGRFISMDEHPGAQRIPLTLNKYLYGNADPVNHIDPSGYMSLGGLGAGMNISGILSTTAIQVGSRSALALARKAKIYDIYDFVNPWPLHFYMFQQSKATRSGLRYDVGAWGGWGAVRNHNPFGVLPGGIVQASRAHRRNLEGKGVRVASHTFGQWLTWHVAVVGTEQNTCALDYSLNPLKGTNCLSWTIGATIKAIAISRPPI